MTDSTVTVNGGGVAMGNGTQISGTAYDVVLINSGGSLTLNNAILVNDLDNPTGTNGRTIAAKGANAQAWLANSTIVISAQSTNPGTNYAHAFTAGVGAADGGHVDLNGSSITASGSKRTVGMQANDGGSIRASNVSITTNGTFGHAVEAYRTPTASETAAHIDLSQVSITTNGSDYSVGIQAVNQGASVTATDTAILTQGTNSFGTESFNGATVALINGSITTRGAGAAGVRIYGGSFGAGSATVNGTRIITSGSGSAGVMAGSPGGEALSSGAVALQNATVTVQGSNSVAASVYYGSTLASNNSTLVSLQGAGIVMFDNATVNVAGTGVEAAGIARVESESRGANTRYHYWLGFDAGPKQWHLVASPSHGCRHGWPRQSNLAGRFDLPRQRDRSGRFQCKFRYPQPRRQDQLYRCRGRELERYCARYR